jgi:putative ABC transport system permease protein
VPTFLGMIGTAVLVAVLFGVVNTMSLAARERTRSTGILKALGFPDGVPARLYLYEAMGIVGIGTAVGIALARGAEGPIRGVLGSRIPMYTVIPETIVTVALVNLAIALLAGALPAWRALRLRPVESLRGLS